MQCPCVFHPSRRPTFTDCFTPYVYCHYSGQLYGKCEQVWDVDSRGSFQDSQENGPGGYTTELGYRSDRVKEGRWVRSFLTENGVARDIYVRLIPIPNPLSERFTQNKHYPTRQENRLCALTV
jgi:hypothetical protein